MRCTEAIRREMVQRRGGRWVVAMTLGVIVALAPLVAHSAIGIVLGIPVVAGSVFGLRNLERRRLIRQLGPALAASKGELPPPSEPDVTYVHERNENSSIPVGWHPGSPV